MFSPHSINRVIARIISLHNELEIEKAKAENRQPELLPHFSVHNLRHTFCTRFCENETNIKIIQEIMGHANYNTTVSYTHVLDDIKQKEALSVGDFLSNKSVQRDEQFEYGSLLGIM